MRLWFGSGHEDALMDSKCLLQRSDMVNAARYLHGETLGRWRTADLLIGLVYLSQRGYEESPAADLATHGQVVGKDLDADGRKTLLVRARLSCHRNCTLLGTQGLSDRLLDRHAGQHIYSSLYNTSPEEWSQAELRGVERCMRYCRILRERQAAAQAAILQTMGINSEDIYVQVHSWCSSGSLKMQM